MKMKFGAIVVDGRGKIGGHVASKNRGGAYLRTKVTPVNSRTSAQLGIRNLFTTLSQAWRGLSQAQRDAWNAATPSFAKTNIFGDIKNPSGFNLYQRLNNVITIVGGEILTNPPLPSEVPSYPATGLTYTVGTPGLAVAFANDPITVDSAVIVRATAPMSAGKNFVKSEFRQISVLDSAATSPANILSAYNSVFGSIGEVGQKIFVELVPVNMLTGQAGSPSRAFSIATT